MLFSLKHAKQPKKATILINEHEIYKMIIAQLLRLSLIEYENNYCGYLSLQISSKEKGVMIDKSISTLRKSFPGNEPAWLIIG